MTPFVYVLVYNNEDNNMIEAIYSDASQAIQHWTEIVNTKGNRSTWFHWSIDVFLLNVPYPTNAEGQRIEQEQENIFIACHFNGLMPHIQERLGNIESCYLRS